MSCKLEILDVRRSSHVPKYTGVPRGKCCPVEIDAAMWLSNPRSRSKADRLRAGSHLEVATFEAQTFITPAFKKLSLVSHGFQIGSSNFGGTSRVMYMVFTLVPSTTKLQHILIFEVQHLFIL